MDTKKNNAHHSKDERCDICGNILTKGLCSNCGWVQMAFPNTVPPEIKDFNTQRKETANKLYKEGCVSKTTIEKLKKDYNNEVSKNRTLEDSLKEEKAKKSAAEQEKELYRDQADKVTKELASLKKKNQSLNADVQSLISLNQSLKTERDNALRKIEELLQNPPVSTGAQLRIIEEHGKYRLQDTSGLVCRANGQSIGEHGIELYDGYVFKVGNVRFTVTVPELDITNINL